MAMSVGYSAFPFNASCIGKDSLAKLIDGLRCRFAGLQFSKRVLGDLVAYSGRNSGEFRAGRNRAHLKRHSGKLP